MIESNQVYCAKAEALFQNLEDGSVPLIVTDPPYGIGYHSNHYKDKNPHAPISNDWNFQIDTFFRDAARVLTDSGAMYLFCRWDVSPLWVPFIAPCGLKLKTIIAWVKDNWTAGDLTGCFGNQYEQVLFITKGRHTLRGKRWPNVWTFPRVSAKKLLHPAQKPTELLERAILASSDGGNVVLDPFCGSGSTGEACVKTGRKFILGDIDETMVVLSKKRLGLPVEEAKEKIVESPSYMPEVADWNVHPEDLLAICELIAANASQLKEKHGSHECG